VSAATTSGADASAAVAPIGGGYWRQSLRQLRRHRQGQIGAVLVLLIVIPTILAPWIAPYDPLTQHAGSELLPPGGQFLLGTDEFGRDLLSRVIHGGRASLVVGLLAVTIALVAGVVLGMFAAYRGGVIDAVLGRSFDVLQAFPGVLIAIAIVALRGPGVENVALAIGIGSAPVFARLARAGTLSARNADFVEAAISMGAGTGRVLRHMFPNIFAPILAQAGMLIAGAILAESGLSFLGLGSQPPDPSWGQMLSVAQGYLRVAPWYAVFPGLALTILLVGMTFLVDALRDVLDPRSEGRRSRS
jgi:peptide/nickel transport system permease protein